MSNNNDFSTNLFLQGVLSQPAIKENYNHGFASRNMRDKSLFKTIVQSTSDIKSINNSNAATVRLDSGSKVDRIIDEFLKKMKKRCSDVTYSQPGTSSVQNNEYWTPKGTSERPTQPKYPSSLSTLTRVPIDTDNRGERILCQRQWRPLETQLHARSTTQDEMIRFGGDESIDDVDIDSETIEGGDFRFQRMIAQRRQQKFPFDSGSTSNRFKYNSNGKRSIYQIETQSPDKTEPRYKFVRDFISPIEYERASQITGAYRPVSSITNNCKKVVLAPGAFSTPKMQHQIQQKECSSNLTSLVRRHLSPSIHPTDTVTAATQTECSHACLLCSASYSSHITKSFSNPYFYEE